MQTYYFRIDVTIAFIFLTYQNQTLTLSKANYILAENCGLTEEAIHKLLPLARGSN